MAILRCMKKVAPTSTNADIEKTQLNILSPPGPPPLLSSILFDESGDSQIPVFCALQCSETV